MSNRKAHRREYSFRRAESFVQHRLRRPFRSDRHARQITHRQTRRSVWQAIAQWIAETSAVTA